MSEFRTRLLHGEAEHLLLETLLTLLHERGLLKARGTQRTDSTHVLAAIRTPNRRELVGETMRFALNRLAVVAPAWLRAHMQPAWPERYEARVENYRPKDEPGASGWLPLIGADGFMLLLQTAYAPDAPAEVRTALWPWRCSVKYGYNSTIAQRTYPAGGKTATSHQPPRSFIPRMTWRRGIASSGAWRGWVIRHI